jgi:MoaA/NifB/PqqE/SkfB family radical SAM enzyme
MTGGSDRVLEIKASVNQILRLVRPIPGRRSGLILSRFLVYLFRKSVLRRPVPYYFSLEITTRCQARCAHCCVEASPKDKRPELTTEELKSLILDARSIGSCFLIFNGGEPLLRPDLPELVRFAADNGFLTRLNTNALLLDRARLAALKKAGLRQCAVSLDSADPNTHDLMRGVPGTQAKVLESLRLLRAARLDSIVYTFVSKRNTVADLRATIDLARSAGARSLYLTPLIAVGRLSGEFGQTLDAQEMESIRRLQDSRVVHMEMPSRLSNCNAYRRFAIHVTAQGDATACPFTPFVLADVRQVPLPVIWDRFQAGLKFHSRGACPLNDRESRREFESYAGDVARRLRSEAEV